jgi:hypothetical protein
MRWDISRGLAALASRLLFRIGHLAHDEIQRLLKAAEKDIFNKDAGFEWSMCISRSNRRNFALFCLRPCCACTKERGTPLVSSAVHVIYFIRGPGWQPDRL